MDTPRSNCSKCGLPHEGLKACSACKTARYCSQECQKAHWKIHKPICRPYSPTEVWGIRVLSDDEFSKDKPEDQRFQHVLLKANHPVFALRQLCPVTKLCGIPLLICSQAIDLGYIPDGGPACNQPAVYLRIEPDNGIAPINWLTLDPGMCVVARQDKRPLTRETIETVWKFHAKLLECFGFPVYDGWAPTQQLMTPASFQLFSRDYYAAQREKGRPGFDYFCVPL